MLAFHTISETNFFHFVWDCVLLLSTSSVTIVVWLIIQRWFYDRKCAKRSSYRIYLDSYINAILSSPLGIESMYLAKLSEAGKEIVCQISGDILRIVKGTEARQIVRLLKHWGLQPFIEKMATNGRKEKRIEALGLLSNFDDESSLKAIEDQIDSEENYIQLAALRGLAKRGGRHQISIDIVLKHLPRIHATNLMMLADILKHFGEDAVPAFTQALKKTEELDVILAIIIALENIASPLATNDLLELTTHCDTNIRAQSIAALGKIKDLRAGPRITEALRDDKMPVRVQAAKAIGLLRYEAALPVLLNISLHDKEWWVRFRAAESIFSFGERGIAVLKSIQDHRTLAGKMAIQMLEEKRVPV